MKIKFIVPHIHLRATGGNIYNRQIITRLDQYNRIEIVTSQEEWWRFPAQEAHHLAPPSVILIDSLLIAETERIRLLRERFKRQAFVLLLHYLYCLNPAFNRSIKSHNERKLLKLFDSVIATSEYARKRLISLSVSESVISVVEPGLNDMFFGPIAHRLSTDPIKMLTVANLFPEKGLYEFITVMEELQDLSWQWHLVGDDSLDSEYSTRFYQRLEGSTIQKRVKLYGPVSEEHIIDIYDSCDLFVLPSLFDNSPLVIREALSRGLPVIAFDVGGIKEIVSDNGSGFLAPAEDWEYLTLVLRKLITDSKLRRDTGRSARLASRAFSSWGEVADKLRQVLEDMVARSSCNEKSEVTMSSPL